MKSLAVLFAGTVLAVGAQASTVSFNYSNALLISPQVQPQPLTMLTAIGKTSISADW